MMDFCICFGYLFSLPILIVNYQFWEDVANSFHNSIHEQDEVKYIQDLFAYDLEALHGRIA